MFLHNAEGECYSRNTGIEIRHRNDYIQSKTCSKAQSKPDEKRY